MVQGNVTPARFARLVTQLKWRLLEGGGQARADLEESLETLEMMAGEIGASVIVVKEIEVPPIMVTLADKVSGYLDPDTGEWADKMSSKRSKTQLRHDGDLSTTPTMTETETEFSTTEFSDSEDTASSYSALFTPADSSRASPHPTILPFSHRLSKSNPSRPSAQSSPAILPIDDDLALFSMEPEPAHRDADDEFELDLDSETVGISVDLEIASVYKPRPVRKRQHNFHSSSQSGRRAHKGKEKKLHPWHTTALHSLAGDNHPILSGNRSGHDAVGPTVPVMTKQEAKSLQRRHARDRRREDKQKTLLAAVQAVEKPAASSSTAVDSASLVSPSLQQCAGVETEDLVFGLQSLHVAVQTTSEVSRVQDLKAKVVTVKEARLIVEALVVRKQSLDENFLDFSGFSLI